MASPFLALITPLGSSGPVDPGWSGGVAPPPQPSHPIAMPPVYPAHPIAPGGSPPGYWGGGPHPMPPIYIPGAPGTPVAPTHPIYNPAYPSHPIYNPPVSVMPPIYYPPLTPTHPIVLPPGTTLPPGIPTHPIELPPEVEPPEEATGPIDWKVVWTPTTGWVVVGVPSVPVPTPSGATA